MPFTGGSVGGTTRRTAHASTGERFNHRHQVPRQSRRPHRAGHHGHDHRQIATGKKHKKPKADDNPNERLIANNRKARHEYEVLDHLECGIVLVGSEVKSLRNGRMSLDEAYGRLDRGEVWLVGCDIQEYTFANQQNHDPRRRRKLLMHRREIKQFAGKAYEKNLTLVPLKMYFKEGKAKVLMGLCRGKKTYDKRESLKKKSMQRDMDRALRGR